MRKFVMGDSHGGYKAIKQCLERSEFDINNDLLIHIGDVCDGWSQTPESVDLLLTIKNLIPIRGNHDVWCWNWFSFGDEPSIWVNQGGRATIEGYLRTGQNMDAKHRNFFSNQHDYYIDEENRLFVHAGFDLMYGFEWSKNTPVSIKRATELHWNRDLAEFNEKSWSNESYKFLDEFKEIFIGHTAHNTTSFNGKGKRNIWNVDTGAGWNGKLTIMDIETKDYWQSDNVKTLYPNERGR